MGVRPDVLAARFPRLYHMAQVGSWPGIQRNGLLSTNALLDLFEVHGEAREALVARHRVESVPIRHPLRGEAVIPPSLSKVVALTDKPQEGRDKNQER